MKHYVSQHALLVPWARYTPDPELFSLPAATAEALGLRHGRVDRSSLVKALRRLCEGSDRPLTTEVLKLHVIDHLAGPMGRSGWDHWDGSWDDERVVPEALIEARERNPRLESLKVQIEGLWAELEGEMAAYDKMLEPKPLPSPKPAAKPKPRSRAKPTSAPSRPAKPKARKKTGNGSKIPFEELARITAEENLGRLSEVWGAPIPKELALEFLCVMPIKELRGLKPFGGTRRFNRDLGWSAERLGLFLNGKPWSKADGLTLKILRNEAFPALIEELEALVPR
jgi:hypothetical protein